MLILSVFKSTDRPRESRAGLSLSILTSGGVSVT